jgi:Sec-independent protein translocase protein TatA
MTTIGWTVLVVVVVLWILIFGLCRAGKGG